MATVFFSYSHKDESLRDQLEAHLALLKNQGLIDTWHDRRILAGGDFDNAISSEMEAANIILLLVSSDFLASSYCYSREMQRAMERHHAGEARVIPVILRACDWKTSQFGKLIAAPRDGKPVRSWPDQDEAFANVAAQVRAAVEAMVSSGPKRPRKTSALTPTSLASSSLKTPTVRTRSSNLRLKKEYSELERDNYLRETFDFIVRYFEDSIAAVEERNPDIRSSFDRIDSRRMSAMLYRNGSAIAECSIRFEGSSSGRGGNGIAFSHDASGNTRSFNELLSVNVGDQSLFLTALGISGGGHGRDKQLSQEGAAEYLWGLFIKRAQA